MGQRSFLRLSWLVVVLLLVACAAAPATPSLATSQAVVTNESVPPTETGAAVAEATATPLPTMTASPTSVTEVPGTLMPASPVATPTPGPETVRFAVIGDYGLAGPAEAAVADLVKGWNPDFVITTGDNNYPDGAAETIDENIGQYYSEFIYPYQGSYGAGAEENRFFPSLGNHDWYTPGAQPYLDYFELPGNERYYDFVWGPVHFFALDGDPNEPDGVTSDSIQAQWLQERLAAATSPWKIVYLHHPPYSSGYHGSIEWARWPFQEWGASAVLAGHDHTYERILVDGFPYFVNGLGGGARYWFEEPVEGSQVRYNQYYGAMLVEASQDSIVFQFINVQGEVIDTYSLLNNPDTVFLPVIQSAHEVFSQLQYFDGY